MEHISSVQQSRAIIEHMAIRAQKNFGRQQKWYVEGVQYGGKRRMWTKEPEYDGAVLKYLVVDLQDKVDWEWQAPKWELLDEVDHDAIQAENQVFLDANIERFQCQVTDVVKPDGVRFYIRPYLPECMDEQRMGTYSVYQVGNVLQAVVWVETMEELYCLFDRCEVFAQNWNREELVELGYLTKDNHTSWLGAQGSHSHAIVAYFRDLGNKIVYFSLDTWCAGNHWQAYEHSPKPETPTLQNVTCKKCQKVINKRAGN